MCAIGHGGLGQDTGDLFLYRFLNGFHRVIPVKIVPCNLLNFVRQRLFLLPPVGAPLLMHTLDRPVLALALAALGRDAFVALDKGPVVRLAIRLQKS